MGLCACPIPRKVADGGRGEPWDEGCDIAAVFSRQLVFQFALDRFGLSPASGIRLPSVLLAVMRPAPMLAAFAPTAGFIGFVLAVGRVPHEDRDDRRDAHLRYSPSVNRERKFSTKP